MCRVAYLVARKRDPLKPYLNYNIYIYLNREELDYFNIHGCQDRLLYP